MEQKYLLKNPESFIPKQIFECGQCFRWKENPDKSYTGIFGKNIITVTQQGKDILFTGLCEGNIKEVITQYFDLTRDYKTIKQELSKVDHYLKKSIQYGSGIRLLNQDLWETIISFIISANNNIPRIKGIIERLSRNYGQKMVWHGKEYYTFPTPKELSKASVQDLRNLGLGFRDKRVYETTQLIQEGKINLNTLPEKNSEEIREELLKLPGVGNKVADCIMLFSTLKKLDAFPVDVWVRRVMNELYLHQEEQKIKQQEITELARKKYANLAGIAQQYLFYWKRETG